LDEHRSSLISRPLSIHEPQARSESPLSKVVTDNEVIGSNKIAFILLLFFVLICLDIYTCYSNEQRRGEERRERGRGYW
jgi:hypothetical protein